jgi:hypothetical protein
LTWDSDFEIETVGSNPDFDLLDSNTNAYMQQVRSFSLQLANLYKTQNAEGLAGALGLPNKKALLTSYEGQFIFSDTNPVDSASVTNESEIAVEFGKRLMLVYSDERDHLASMTFSKGKMNYTVFIDYFRFARLRGKWKVALPGSEFFDLNISDDSSANEKPK